MGYRYLTAAALIAATVAPASAACVSDVEVEAAFGPAIRANAAVLDTAPFYGKALCSGLTLAQAIQKVRASAFPEEAAQQKAEAARLAALETTRPPVSVAPTVPRSSAAAAPVVAQTRAVLVTTASTGLSLDQLLDRAVQADSRSWMMNRYIVGSMRGARYVSGNKAHTSYVARGIYDYNGFGAQRTGWVVIRVVGGDLECFEYHDQPGVCRRPWASLGQQNMLGLAGSMMSDDGGSGRSSVADNNAIDEANRRRSSGSTSPPPAPAPVTPIGGSNGLYGCASPPCM